MGILAGALGLMAVACDDAADGSSSSSSSSSTGGGNDLDAACADFASAFCDLFDQCQPDFVKIGYGDVATCKSRAALACKQESELPGSNWTPANLGTCTTAVKGVACAALEGEENSAAAMACSFIDHGTLDAGTPCAESSQCKSGLCEKDADPTCGVCADPIAEGQSCGSGTSGYCASGTSCVNDVCVKDVPKGGACGEFDNCAGGTRCIDGTCADPLAEGATCDPTAFYECADGLECDETTTKCVKTPPNKIANAGEACGFDQTTNEFTLCIGGTSCKDQDATTGLGKCKALIADGEACTVVDGDDDCFSPASCVEGKCSLEAPVCK